MIGKKRQLGKKINELKVGDSYNSSKKIEDRDLLLYLGLTDDANPLFIQHDYASQTPCKQPIVPSVMLYGIISSMISMHLPGPGSHIKKQELTFPQPVCHYETVNVKLEITEVNEQEHNVVINVVAHNDEQQKVIEGVFVVCPPHKAESITAKSLENFY